MAARAEKSRAADFEEKKESGKYSLPLARLNPPRLACAVSALLRAWAAWAACKEAAIMSGSGNGLRGRGGEQLVE